MKMVKKIICLDLDNVICFTNKERNYKKSKPNLKAIKTINLLYQRGHTIKIFTARGMEKFKGKQSLVKKKYFLVIVFLRQNIRADFGKCSLLRL